jgi:hypothetical protein
VLLKQSIQTIAGGLEDNSIHAIVVVVRLTIAAIEVQIITRLEPRHETPPFLFSAQFADAGAAIGEPDQEIETEFRE